MAAAAQESQATRAAQAVADPPSSSRPAQTPSLLRAVAVVVITMRTEREVGAMRQQEQGRQEAPPQVETPCMEARVEHSQPVAQLDKKITVETRQQVHFIRVEMVQHGLALEVVVAIMEAAAEVLENRLVVAVVVALLSRRLSQALLAIIAQTGFQHHLLEPTIRAAFMELQVDQAAQVEMGVLSSCITNKIDY